MSWNISYTGSPFRYLTGFNATEDPLSEGGKWASPPQPSGIKWTRMVTDAATADGIAYGTNGALDLFDDSYAKFVGIDFPSPTSIEITATLYRSASLGTGNDYPEKELWFCIDDGVSGNDAFLRGYEVMLNPAGTSNMGKWLGGQSAPDIPILDVAGQDFGAPGDIADGTEFKAIISRSGSTNTITTYLNGSRWYWCVDDGTVGGVPSYTVGRPGFGAFRRPTGAAHNLFGFRSIEIRAI